MEIKTMAEVYRLGISIGFQTVQDVIRWADKLIEQFDSPPYEIIELSLSAKEKPDDVCFKLKMVKGEFDIDLPPKIILGLLGEYLNTTQDTSNVIMMLDRLIEHLPESCEWIELKIHWLSDGFYLAKQNIYGDLQEVENNLKKFLMQFEGYTVYLSF